MTQSKNVLDVHQIRRLSIKKTSISSVVLFGVIILINFDCFATTLSFNISDGNMIDKFRTSDESPEDDIKSRATKSGRIFIESTRPNAYSITDKVTGEVHGQHNFILRRPCTSSVTSSVTEKVVYANVVLLILNAFETLLNGEKTLFPRIEYNDEQNVSFFKSSVLRTTES